MTSNHLATSVAAAGTYAWGQWGEHAADGYVSCRAGSGIYVDAPKLWAVNPSWEQSLKDGDANHVQAVAYRAHLYKWSGTQWQWVTTSGQTNTWGPNMIFPAADGDSAHLIASGRELLPDYGTGYYKVAWEFWWYDQPIAYAAYLLGRQPTHNQVTGYDFLFKNDAYYEPTPDTATSITISMYGDPTRTGFCYMPY